ncbi:tyrosine-protein phosphatase [Novosphingobium sp. M1R2S20]|uniref:Tyrosine-protein phosphatase n=1 Tax=Novosphingobium rhizovicinum TaxID=3228928 RepID=A0ABV3RDD7_9SPHN
MLNVTIRALMGGALTFACVPALALEAATVTRVDAETVELNVDALKPRSIWISADTQVDASDQRALLPGTDGKLKLTIPASERRYVIVRDSHGKDTVVAERALPLEQGSNFRDVGGYMTKDGRTVRWGKAFRSGAMPLLSDADYALVEQLDLGTVVDLRSLDEREVAPDLLDDRTGALFIANDYSLKPLMAKMRQGDGENMYSGMETLLAPQLRSLFKQLIAGDKAVVYHCSAGQDRTGIATALLYDALGVDRETILKDYHLSTLLRRPEWEMPKVDPKDHPNNPIVQYYFAKVKDEPMKAEPLYTPGGVSHLAQFFDHLDGEYGGSAGYLKKELGFSDQDLERLRAVMLD